MKEDSKMIDKIIDWHIEKFGFFSVLILVVEAILLAMLIGDFSA